MGKPSDVDRIQELEAQLAELKSGANAGNIELAKALIAMQPKAATIFDGGGMSEERKNVVQGKNPDGTEKLPLKWRDIPGIGPDGCTFDLHVIESRIFEHGRISSLSNFTHPKGCYIHEEEGGLVPDGVPIYRADVSHYVPEGREPNKEMLDEGFARYRTLRWYVPTARMILGDGGKLAGEMKAMWCRDPATGLLTPWREGSIGRAYGTAA